MKDRITLLFCVNASGDLKIKPMLVYHSETPRIFKKENVCKPMLRFYWKSNTKAWVTRSIFTEWIVEMLGPTVKKYLREENLPEKACFFWTMLQGIHLAWKKIWRQNLTSSG